MLTIPTGSVTDANGAGLDGAFTNHSGTATGQAFPSGHGTGVDSNTDFKFLFDELPGAIVQAGIVSSTDFTKIRDQTLEGPTILTGNLLPFSPYADVDGSALIISTEVTLGAQCASLVRCRAARRPHRQSRRRCQARLPPRLHRRRQVFRKRKVLRRSRV